MNNSIRKRYLKTYREGLLHDTLPFWIENCVDHEHGGFMISLDRQGKVVDTDKGVWQQARFTWLLGELYNQVEPRQNWLELALHGIRFIEKHCFDPHDNRMWFHVDRAGQPIRKRRYSFGESFAAIAFAALHRATGDQSFREQAIACFESFINRPERTAPSEQKFTDIRPTRGIGHPMIALVTAQQLRSNLDWTEANSVIDECIQQIRQFHVKEELQCVMEQVGPQGQLLDHFDGRTLNPGHAIEAAWFIMEEGQYRADQQLIDLGVNMLDWMWQRGWDPVHGGILYFVSVDEKPIQEYWHDMKFWWPHNEAIIATLLAWKLTGDAKYTRWHQQVHEWSYQHFPDPEHGEWYGYLNRDGSISNPLKGNLWKGPFHLPRMQLKCWKLLESED